MEAKNRPREIVQWMLDLATVCRVTFTCSQCGRGVPEHERDIRFQLPDPVWDRSRHAQSDEVWMDGESPAQSDLLAVDGLGSFIRALLPVQLTGGYFVTFGVWVSVPHEQLVRAFETWDEPEYQDLVIDGVLANALAPWDVLGQPVHAEVRYSDTLPYCISSTSASMTEVLRGQWDHEHVLSALPD